MVHWGEGELFRQYAEDELQIADISRKETPYCHANNRAEQVLDSSQYAGMIPRSSLYGSPASTRSFDSQGYPSQGLVSPVPFSSLSIVCQSVHRSIRPEVGWFITDRFELTGDDENQNDRHRNPTPAFDILRTPPFVISIGHELFQELGLTIQIDDDARRNRIRNIIVGCGACQCCHQIVPGERGYLEYIFRDSIRYVVLIVQEEGFAPPSDYWRRVA